MAEEASKGFLRGTTEKIRDKFGEKVAEKVFEWVVSLGLGSLVLAWVTREWACIRQPLCQVPGWLHGALIVIAVLGIAGTSLLAMKLHRTRRELQAAGAKAEPAPPPAIPNPLFQPIEVLDKRLALRWFIRRRPREWLHWRNTAATVSYTEVHAVLDGPFHAAEGCNAAVKEIAVRGLLAETVPTSPTLEETCRNCGRRIFRGANVPVWPVRDQLIEELQRLERNGTRLEGRDMLDGPVVVENPAYWHLMQPPK